MLQEGSQRRSLRTGFYTPNEPARSHTASYIQFGPKARTQTCDIPKQRTWVRARPRLPLVLLTTQPVRHVRDFGPITRERWQSDEQQQRLHSAQDLEMGKAARGRRMEVLGYQSADCRADT